MRNFLVIVFIAFIASCTNDGNQASKHANKTESKNVFELKDSIQNILDSANARGGISLIGPDTSLSIHGQDHFRMMSVAKFPQALMLLHLVDQNIISADKRIMITEADLKQRTSSTLSKDYQLKSFDLSIKEALDYSVGQSDNVTSNVIFAMEGGPKAVESYIHSIGIHGIGLGVDYWHLTDETADSNWCTPEAMSALLEKFYNQQILSKENTGLLWDVMINGPTGFNRIKGGLPEGTIVGHKTGTGNTDDTTGRIMAFNDVGIVLLPDGKHFTLSVLINDSYESEEATAKLIADITAMVWKYYTSR